MIGLYSFWDFYLCVVCSVAEPFFRTGPAPVTGGEIFELFMGLKSWVELTPPRPGQLGRKWGRLSSTQLFRAQKSRLRLFYSPGSRLSLFSSFTSQAIIQDCKSENLESSAHGGSTILLGEVVGTTSFHPFVRQHLEKLSSLFYEHALRVVYFTSQVTLHYFSVMLVIFQNTHFITALV